MRGVPTCIAALVLALAAPPGCRNVGPSSGADGDADTDVDTDADTDADSDADGDTDVDTDVDTDADGDTDVDIDADSDTDSDPIDPDGPGVLCGPEAPDLFDNSLSPYAGGEESVDLEVAAFTFFGCSHCAEFAELWRQLWVDRPDIRSRVRMYFHHFPFDYTASWDIHAASVAAGNQGMEQFWQLHDFVFGELLDSGELVGIDELRGYCEETLGLDMDEFDADFSDPYTMELLTWDKEQAQAVGVTGTPSVFICGEKISWGEIEAVVDGYLYEE
jgi:protein-disulfide isomerase